MQKVNDLFGKRVINQVSGDQIASVRDVVLSTDSRRIVALVIGEGGWSSKEEQVVPWSSVVSVGEFVIADGSTSFVLAEEDTATVDLRKDAQKITGKTVMCTSGERLGTVGDMFFDQSGDIVCYEVKQGGVFGGGDNPMLRAEDVMSIGKDALIATSSSLASRTEMEIAPDSTQNRVVGDGYATDGTAPVDERTTYNRAGDPLVDVPHTPGERVRD